MKTEWPTNPEGSSIIGTGYGAAHMWKYSHTSPGRCSLYVCQDCGIHFWHHYPSIPNIFEAIAKDPQGIPCVCEKGKVVQP